MTSKMTYTGLFDEKRKEEQISKLKKEVKNLKEISKEHQKLNGKLREEIEKLKKEIELLQFGNENLGIYRESEVKKDLQEIVKKLKENLKVAKPLIQKYPKNVFFRISTDTLASIVKEINNIAKRIKNRIN